MPQSPSPIADDISRSINSVVEAIAPFCKKPDARTSGAPGCSSGGQLFTNRRG
jgi:hypothetical protein